MVLAKEVWIVLRVFLASMNNVVKDNIMCYIHYGYSACFVAHSAVASYVQNNVMSIQKRMCTKRVRVYLVAAAASVSALMLLLLVMVVGRFCRKVER